MADLLSSEHTKVFLAQNFDSTELVAYTKAEEASSMRLVVWKFNKDVLKLYEAMGVRTRNRRVELNL